MRNRMTVSMVTVAMAGGLLASAAPAQQAGVTAGRSDKAAIDDIVCTFVPGECGGEADAPVPTIAAPDTRSFRLATGRAAIQPNPAAGRANYRPVATGRGEMRSGARTARPATVKPRYIVPTTRAVTPGAGPATPRADLLLPFRYNSAVLTPAAEARARTFARALQVDALKNKRFLIEGHTDLRGSRELNMDLSRRRAQAVADFLVAQGVDRTRVEVKGVGPDEPLPGRSAKAEANRRVEAVLLS